MLLALVVGSCFGTGSVLTKDLTVVSSVPGQSVVSWAIRFDPLLLAMANGITVLAGLLVFGEHITTLRAAGTVLIVGGTTLLHLKSSSIQAGPV